MNYNHVVVEIKKKIKNVINVLYVMIEIILNIKKKKIILKLLRKKENFQKRKKQVQKQKHHQKRKKSQKIVTLFL